ELLCGMHLFLRRVEPGREAYRVILKDDVSETEIGSIGRHSVTRWTWGIDTLLSMRELDSGGYGVDRKDCQRRFKGAWGAFVARPARLAEFMLMKRKLKVAQAFDRDMRAFFKASTQLEKDEIASRQLHALQAFQRPRDEKLRLADVKQMFLEGR